MGGHANLLVESDVRCDSHTWAIANKPLLYFQFHHRDESNFTDFKVKFSLFIVFLHSELVYVEIITPLLQPKKGELHMPFRKVLSTRRDFLKVSTTTVLTAPFIVPRSVLGQNAAIPPSNRITLGFIGMGIKNRQHLREFLKDFSVQVIAVCDVDTKRREHAKKMVEDRYSAEKKSGRYEGCAAYNDFRKVLARDDIDAVVIATPDHWHAIPVIEACQAGKDIYCEKPLSLKIHEAKVMIDAVRKHKRIFQTGSQQRSEFGGKFRLACELIRNGRIGKLQHVTVGVGDPSKWCDLPEEKLEPGLDWNRWLGPAPKRPYNEILSPRGIHNHFPLWRNYREYSGGGMTDMGAHHFDIVQWALDADHSGPVEIIPPENPKAKRGVKMIYANGVVVEHGGPSGCVFYGTDGVISVDRGRLTSKPDAVVKEPLGLKDKRLFKSPGHKRNWINCIRSRKLPICDVETGARSVTVCHLGNLAYWNHRKLKWDPKNWKFIKDEEANTWLDYERRDPWQLPKV